LDGKTIATVYLSPPATQEALAKYSTEKQSELKDKVAAYLDDLIQSGKPSTMEALIIVGFK
jgi:hypothetical protein